MTHAQRFVRAYNQIDSSLRKQYDLSPSIGFSEMIRRCAQKSAFVHAMEDKLLDYARLRNAIVHQGVREEIIAEPHADVVEEMERIAKFIMTPPNAFETVARKDVVAMRHEQSLAEALAVMYETGFYNLPVLKNGRLLGVLTNRLAVAAVGRALSEGKPLQSFAEELSVGSIVKGSQAGIHYEILGRSATLSDVLDAFERNRKLPAVLITERGIAEDSILGIITVADIPEIMRVLAEYD